MADVRTMEFLDCIPVEEIPWMFRRGRTGFPSSFPLSFKLGVDPFQLVLYALSSSEQTLSNQAGSKLAKYTVQYALLRPHV